MLPEAPHQAVGAAMAALERRVDHLEASLGGRMDALSKQLGDMLREVRDRGSELPEHATLEPRPGPGPGPGGAAATGSGG